MIIREYQKGDIYKIIKQDVEEMMTLYIREEMMLEGVSFTGIKDNIIVGSAGLFNLWEGVYEAWIAIDKEIRKDFKTVYFIMKTLRNCFSELPSNVTRIHAHVNERLEGREHFMKFLGFEKEAILSDYFPGKANCIIYRRLV